VVALLSELIEKLRVHVVVHPDTIHDYRLWQRFGDKLCVENMDHRKAIGRTADELESIFSRLPDARLCFDIGHAHEIDRSMSHAYEILRRFRNRITYIHASEVSDECKHRAFSTASRVAFGKVADLIPDSVPECQVGEQLKLAKVIFEKSASGQEGLKEIGANQRSNGAISRNSST
jgi:hypothetical protein